jgi:tetratricopeptide (TPR) repeat protein
MPKLSAEIHDRVTRLAAEGDALAEKHQYIDAIAAYDRARALLPSNFMQYEAAAWLLVAKGDVQLAAGLFGTASMCAKGNNPYVKLKIGVCQFRLGEISRALQSLARVFISEREKIFEEEDPRLLQFLSLHLEPPTGQPTLAPGVVRPTSSPEVGRELGGRFVAELSRRILDRLVEFGGTRPAAAVVIGYNDRTIVDVPLLGIRGTDEPDAWIPDSYGNFAQKEVQLYDAPLAKAAMKLALVADENHPASRELYLEVARAVRARAPAVARVTADFIAYPSDFSGKDLKKNLAALGIPGGPPDKTKRKR